MKYIYKFSTIILMTLLGISFSSCRKFLEVGTPKTEIGADAVFNTDAVATSAILSIYGDMNSSAPTALTIKLSSLLGEAADEMQTAERVPQSNYYTNTLTANDNDDFWSPFYKDIYYANLAIQNLQTSKSVTPAVKQQLLGEAIFIRAFLHFYLVNLYGDIPYITATDYKATDVVTRMPTFQVYALIVQDLKTAKSYLKDNFPDPNNNIPAGAAERIRANKSAAGTLLAKTYLNLHDWKNAKLEADSIMASPNYELLANIDQVFIKNSRETIFALQNSNVSTPNTFEATKYVLTSAPSFFGQAISLTNSFYNTAFEANDKRKTNWIGSYTSTLPAGTWYYPYKYKITTTTGVAQEYAIVFRLAELYLIRAEALAQLDLPDQAVLDLNKIRARARGTVNALPDYPANMAKADLLNAILKERRVELFAECGHRWLDLKRASLADQVLSVVKGVNWHSFDTLFPIPNNQLIFDPNMKGQQNPGY